MAEPERPARSLGTPLDPQLLADALGAPARPVPWRALALFFIPAAAVAAGRGAQWLLEGPEPGGDHLARWLWLSAASGLVLGTLLGRLLTKSLGGRLIWSLWGALSPLLLALAVNVGVAAARPVREWRARVGEDKCRKTRTVCRTGEFRAACEAAGRPLAGARERGLRALGPPVFERCDASGCTLRWSYAGPWSPDDWVAPGSLLCSLVTDAAGQGVRASVAPGFAPKD
jgi:hypothetical protein